MRRVPTIGLSTDSSSSKRVSTDFVSRGTGGFAHDPNFESVKKRLVETSRTTAWCETMRTSLTLVLLSLWNPASRA